MVTLVILGLIFLATRLPLLTRLPVFADEAIYIHWAQVIWHDAGNRFIPLSDGKPPLFMWLMVPFLKVFEDPLVAGRLLSTVSGLATLVGVYLLTKKLFNSKVALVAGVLVITQPFLLFYDRMALVDSLLTAFGVWSFYLAYLLLEKPTIGKGIILGTLWGGAVLTKPTGIYFPLLAPPLLLLYPVRKWWPKIKQLIVPSVLAGGYGLGFVNVLRLSPAFHMLGSRTSDYLRTWQDFVTQGLEYIPDTAGVLFHWLVSYFSWALVAWLAAGLWLTWRHKEKKIGLILLWVVVPFAIQMVIGKIIYPRYLLVTAPFLVIFLAWTGVEGWKLVEQKRLALLKVFFGVLAAATVAYWLYFDFWLFINPARAPFDYAEQEQYLYQWSAGYGIKEIADHLKSLPADKDIVVATEGYFGTLPDGLLIYLDGRTQIDVYGVGQPIFYLPDEVAKALQEGKETYLVVNSTRMKIENGESLELIAEYPKPTGPKGQEKLLLFKATAK
jgi:4-amino-4-deoxy-L-arabinose transferase-like glycosyltransferase